MMTTLLRGAGGAVLLLALAGGVSAAENPIELAWEQLIPQGDRGAASSPSAWGVVQHGQLGAAPDAAAGAAVITDYNGKRVRLSGFMVPLELEGERVTTFLLVPYFGACIHVPPPPANQIVYVDNKEGIRVRDPFEPVSVTGRFATAALSTELADVGYRLAADEVTLFVEDRPRFLFELR
jgi:uncharacterized protein